MLSFYKKKEKKYKGPQISFRETYWPLGPVNKTRGTTLRGW